MFTIQYLHIEVYSGMNDIDVTSTNYLHLPFLSFNPWPFWIKSLTQNRMKTWMSFNMKHEWLANQINSNCCGSLAHCTLSLFFFLFFSEKLKIISSFLKQTKFKIKTNQNSILKHFLNVQIFLELSWRDQISSSVLGMWRGSSTLAVVLSVVWSQETSVRCSVRESSRLTVLVGQSELGFGASGNVGFFSTVLHGQSWRRILARSCLSSRSFRCDSSILWQHLVWRLDLQLSSGWLGTFIRSVFVHAHSK